MDDHPIRLRDSRSGDKVRLRPRDWRLGVEPPKARRVRLYVCGPTVYDRAHIGNARPAVVFDVLARLLRHVYGPDRVTYVRNVTDVEDKIIDRAAERFPDLPPEDGVARLTRETTEMYHSDLAALGCAPPDAEPRATAHVPGMVVMIGTLIERGHAYVAEGHVLFDVASFPDYGALSGRDVDDMIAGARVEVAPYKRDPMDFVLWKPSTPEQPGWDSPWGRGRPGWHIECSAMSAALLGPDFDIHGGGSDLLFPHHENEVAQSLCAHPGSGFAEHWIHNGMIRVDGRKMSKSLGNVTTTADVLAEMDGIEARVAMLMTHHRGELDWDSDRKAEAAKRVARWRESAGRPGLAALEAARDAAPDDAVVRALCDDLNAPGALARVDALSKAARKSDEAAAALVGSLALLGVDLAADPATRRAAEAADDAAAGRPAAPAADPDDAARVEALLARRAEARRDRDFAAADAIRDALAAADVVVTDTPQGSEWSPGPAFDPAKLEDAE